MRVSPGGVKTFFYTYKFEGRKRRMTLGQYPGVRLIDARKKHRAALDVRQNGKDPAAIMLKEKAENMRAPTVGAIAKLFLENWSKKRKKSWEEDERMLDTYILTKWKNKKAENISKKEVVELIDEIAIEAPIQANRVLACVRKMYNWAIEKSMIETSPCASVKAPSKENEKKRNLNISEIKILFDKLETASMCDDLKKVLKLILLTGQRPGEVVGAHSSEFDGRWWTVPGERTKNGLENRVYLTDSALELFGTKSGFIFESPKKKKNNCSIEVNAISKAVRKNRDHFSIERWTPHDLRRTAATLIASLGHSKFVDKVLNHQTSTVTRKYDKYEYDAEKKAALLALEIFILTNLSKSIKKKESNLIQFRQINKKCH